MTLKKSMLSTNNARTTKSQNQQDRRRSRKPKNAVRMVRVGPKMCRKKSVKAMDG